MSIIYLYLIFIIIIYSYYLLYCLFKHTFIIYLFVHFWNSFSLNFSTDP